MSNYCKLLLLALIATLLLAVLTRNVAGEEKQFNKQQNEEQRKTKFELSKQFQQQQQTKNAKNSAVFFDETKLLPTTINKSQIIFGKLPTTTATAITIAIDGSKNHTTSSQVMQLQSYNNSGMQSQKKKKKIAYTARQREIALLLPMINVNSNESNTRNVIIADDNVKMKLVVRNSENVSKVGIQLQNPPEHQKRQRQQKKEESMLAEKSKGQKQIVANISSKIKVEQSPHRSLPEEELEFQLKQKSRKEQQKLGMHSKNMPKIDQQLAEQQQYQKRQQQSQQKQTQSKEKSKELKQHNQESILRTEQQKDELHQQQKDWQKNPKLQVHAKRSPLKQNSKGKIQAQFHESNETQQHYELLLQEKQTQFLAQHQENHQNIIKNRSDIVKNIKFHETINKNNEQLKITHSNSTIKATTKQPKSFVFTPANDFGAEEEEAIGKQFFETKNLKPPAILLNDLKLKGNVVINEMKAKEAKAEGDETIKKSTINTRQAKRQWESAANAAVVNYPISQLMPGDDVENEQLKNTSTIATTTMKLSSHILNKLEKFKVLEIIKMKTEDEKIKNETGNNLNETKTRQNGIQEDNSFMRTMKISETSQVYEENELTGAKNYAKNAKAENRKVLKVEAGVKEKHEAINVKSEGFKDLIGDKKLKSTAYKKREEVSSAQKNVKDLKTENKTTVANAKETVVRELKEKRNEEIISTKMFAKSLKTGNDKFVNNVIQKKIKRAESKSDQMATDDLSAVEMNQNETKDIGKEHLNAQKYANNSGMGNQTSATLIEQNVGHVAVESSFSDSLVRSNRTVTPTANEDLTSAQKYAIYFKADDEETIGTSGDEEDEVQKAVNYVKNKGVRRMSGNMQNAEKYANNFQPEEYKSQSAAETKANNVGDTLKVNSQSEEKTANQQQAKVETPTNITTTNVNEYFKEKLNETQQTDNGNMNSSASNLTLEDKKSIENKRVKVEKTKTIATRDLKVNGNNNNQTQLLSIAARNESQQLFMVTNNSNIIIKSDSNSESNESIPSKMSNTQVLAAATIIGQQQQREDKEQLTTTPEKKHEESNKNNKNILQENNLNINDETKKNNSTSMKFNAKFETTTQATEAETTMTTRAVHSAIAITSSTMNGVAATEHTLKTHAADIVTTSPTTITTTSTHIIPTAVLTRTAVVVQSNITTTTTPVIITTTALNNNNNISLYHYTPISKLMPLYYNNSSSNSSSNIMEKAATTKTTTTTTLLSTSSSAAAAAAAAAAASAWPVKHASVMEGDVILGGLMMVHSREDSITCGPIMPQGGIQALEAMLYTLDQVNKQKLLPNITLGAHILDDCDKDTYGLEMAVDFIKGECF